MSGPAHASDGEGGQTPAGGEKALAFGSRLNGKPRAGGIRRHLRNLGANWFAQLAGMVVFFFLTPFIIRKLGDVEYGLWTLLTIVTGYLGVFDLGVRVSIGRHVTLHLGAGDHEGVDQTLRTGLTFYSCLSAVLLAAAAALGWLFPLLFPKTPEGYHTTILILLPLLALNLWLSAVRAVFASVLTAHDRFDLAQAADLSVLAITTTATVLALHWGHRIAALAVILVAGGCLGAVANYLLARRVYPRARALPPALCRKRMKELFGFGIPAFLGRLAQETVNRGDVFVVGILFGSGAVTVYALGAMLLFYSTSIVEQVGSTLYPSIQRSVGAGDWDAVRYAGVRMMKLALIAGLGIFLGFLCFGDEFIRLWMSHEKGGRYDDAAWVMAFLAASRIVQVVPQCEATLLYSAGRVWFLTTIALVEGVLMVGAGIVLASQPGVGLGFGVRMWLVGVAAGSLVARALLAPVYIWYGYQRLRLRVGSIAWQVLVPGAGVAAAFVGWCLLVRWIIPGGRWAWFAVQVIVALLGYAVFAAALLVPRSDRARVWKFLGRTSP